MSGKGRVDVVVEIHRIVLPAGSPMGYAYGLLRGGRREVRVCLERYPAEVLGRALVEHSGPKLMRFDPWDVSREAWKHRTFDPLPDSQVWPPAEEV